MKKTIGIIGGMGPLATADLFRKIVVHTQASCDQDHIHILIDNNTAIPDRTAALLHSGADPLPQMEKSAHWLESGGADCLIMPCNTAHCYHAALQKLTNIPLLNMLELTCQHLVERGICCAGLLATNGTVETGIYNKTAEKYGITLLTPAGEDQDAVMELIYQGVKAGKATFDTTAVKKAADSLLNRGAGTIILGCTELPLAVEMYRLEFPATDPTLELAKGAIRFAGGSIQ
ncbi:MAG: amino acid racemase [Clostridiales bacterium]|nr:amino acid racemase [Clostridiales bacterium]